jgi:hypothetical protein
MWVHNFDRTFLNKYSNPTLCAWIHFPRHNDHMTKSPEQNSLHVCIKNDVLSICILCHKIALIQAICLRNKVLKIFICCYDSSVSSLMKTVQPMYNDHPRDPKYVAVVDRWSLFRGIFMLK